MAKPESIINKKYIEKELSKNDMWGRNLFSLIKSPSIKDGVIKAWLHSCEKGGWNKINDIPFTLLIPTKISLLEHTLKVTSLCATVAKNYKNIKLDILIAGALTHDVGKLVEYMKTKDKIVKSKLGKQFRHPVIGYGLAIESGLPDEVAHIIFAHSHEGDSVERSGEAIIVSHCDFIEFELAKIVNLTKNVLEIY